jgi:plastocyanin
MDRSGRRPHALLVVLAVPVIAALAVLMTSLAAGDDDAPSANGASPASTITIEGFDYSPGTLEGEAGAPIQIVNRDDTVHTVTARDDSAFDTGDLDGGATATITIDEPGTYEYFCAIHDYMTGEIRIRG